MAEQNKRMVTFCGVDISAVALSLTMYSREQEKCGHYFTAATHYRLAAQAWAACKTPLSDENARDDEANAARCLDMGRAERGIESVRAYGS